MKGCERDSRVVAVREWLRCLVVVEVGNKQTSERSLHNLNDFRNFIARAFLHCARNLLFFFECKGFNILVKYISKLSMSA